MDNKPLHVSILVRLPLRIRRRLLRLGWLVLRVVSRPTKGALAAILKYAIRVGTAEAAKLDDAVLFHDQLTSLEWAAITSRTRSQLRRDSRSVVFENAGLLDRLSQTGKPVIFAPLHMGCFALPFAKMMHDHFPNRRMLILRAREDRPEESLAMERVSEIGVDMRFLNVADKQNYVDAIRFARSGAVIVTFVDLPASYGGAVPIELFGRPARLAMGIASLARVSGAVVVPMAVYSESDGDTVCFGRPFEVVDGGMAEKMRVADLIRRHIEVSVLRSPAQWHMWARLDEFIVDQTQDEAA